MQDISPYSELKNQVSVKNKISVKESLFEYEMTKPEIIFYWNDLKTEATGWLVINSLRGGAAGGGTRMRKGLKLQEIISLAKTMEIKFTISGPQIGGAKSGINFDPNDPRKKDVLYRWFKAIKPILKSYYGTGGDLNINLIKEISPLTEKMKIWHPQEGIFNGHLQGSDIEKKNRLDHLKNSMVKVLKNENFSPDINREYTIADMITGYGVAESIRHFYNIYGGNFIGKRAVIQGFGNVGAATAFYLSQMGVKIVGIIDKKGIIVNKNGFPKEKIREFFIQKDETKSFTDSLLPYKNIYDSIWKIPMDIFIPCAASGIIKKEHVEMMMNSGLELISCGANIPFADKETFYGSIMEYTDVHISLIPDFVSNCGMARFFAYFIENKIPFDENIIFNDVSNTIKKALEDIYAQNETKIMLSKTAFEIVLKKIKKEE